MDNEIATLNLSAAGHAISHLRDTSSTIRARLEKVAALLEALPGQPTEPSLVYRAPGQPKPVAIPIGEGLTVGRGESCQIRFAERPELSRTHFSVRPEAEK